ncbi:hypothetical protein KUTeg_004816 [Tegillarca granosa]|uniref:E3 ubiquitin-protein ligase TM129 n=1 Tax=Tegillarca granosa TaxID=220873 RepID=A0ABQ9FHY2_TEGGR|nr:hypothetical protein KUTeg_004816 [Tegillarca granosa]
MYSVSEIFNMTHSEEAVNLLFTLLYIFFSLCLIAPPTEFVSAGITIQNVLSNFLGSEDMNFIYYHIKRTSATVFVHSLFPLGYYVCLGLFSPQLQLFYPWDLNAKWKLFLAICLILPLVAAGLIYYWSRRKWDNHPIARQLHYLGNGDSWRAVASSINIEFRRFDKFMSGVKGRQVVVTDSWVMKVSTYFVYVAHQNDIHLTLAATEEHSISYESLTSVQYLNMVVQSINQNVKPFTIRKLIHVLDACRKMQI